MRRKILVLDDELNFAHVIKMTLELTGYEVRSTVRSTTFMQVALDFRPDLILLDCMMPVLDGGEVAAQIQANPVLKDTPFLFFTATSDEPEQRTSRCCAGLQTYLPKTMELDDLVRFLDAKLDAADAQRTATDAPPDESAAGNEVRP